MFFLLIITNIAEKVVPLPKKKQKRMSLQSYTFITKYIPDNVPHHSIHRQSRTSQEGEDFVCVFEASTLGNV